MAKKEKKNSSAAVKRPPDYRGDCALCGEPVGGDDSCKNPRCPIGRMLAEASAPKNR